MSAGRASLLALLCAACSGGDGLPSPDLTEVEPQVRLKLERTRDAAARDPSVDDLTLYARTLHAHGMADEAEQVYLLAAGRGDAEVAYECLHLAGCAAAALQPERALGYFTRALTLQPDRVATHVRLALVAERLGQTAVAREHYQRAVQLHPSSHAWLGLGRLDLAAGDASAAVEVLERARALEPGHRQVYEALARAYARLGEVEASRRAAAQAGNLSAAQPFDDPLMAQVEAEDVTYRAFEGRALRLLDAERRQATATGRRDRALLERALDAIDAARRARPDSVAARHYRGLILAGLGRAAEAVDELEAVVEAQPTDANARFALAGMLRAVGRTNDAVAQLDAVLDREPRRVDALMQRAALRLDAGESEAAQRDLRAILEVAPDNGWARARVRD